MQGVDTEWVLGIGASHVLGIDALRLMGADARRMRGVNAERLLVTIESIILKPPQYTDASRIARVRYSCIAQGGYRRRAGEG